MLTGRTLYSSTMNEDTEKSGDSIADWRAAPLPMVSRELSVLKTSGLLKACFVNSKMIGVLVASPIISTEEIKSVFKPKVKLVSVSREKKNMYYSLYTDHPLVWGSLLNDCNFVLSSSYN